MHDSHTPPAAASYFTHSHSSLPPTHTHPHTHTPTLSHSEGPQDGMITEDNALASFNFLNDEDEDSDEEEEEEEEWDETSSSSSQLTKVGHVGGDI